VTKGQYAVALDPVTVMAELTAVAQTSLHNGFLEAEVAKAKAKVQEALPDLDPLTIESRALADGLREYNLAFRREMLALLTALQARRISELQAEFGFTTCPPSTFNPQREVIEDVGAGATCRIGRAGRFFGVKVDPSSHQWEGERSTVREVGGS